MFQHVDSPPSFYQSYGSSFSCSSQEGHSSAAIPRRGHSSAAVPGRLASLGLLQRGSFEVEANFTGPLYCPQHSYQLGEIRPYTQASFDFPGYGDPFERSHGISFSENLQNIIKDFLGYGSPPAQDWLILLGHLSSLIHLVPGGRRRMRSLQFHLLLQWDRRLSGSHFQVTISEEVRQDIVVVDSFQPPLGSILAYVHPRSDPIYGCFLEGMGSLSPRCQTVASGQGRICKNISLLELRAVRLGLKDI